MRSKVVAEYTCKVLEVVDHLLGDAGIRREISIDRVKLLGRNVDQLAVRRVLYARCHLFNPRKQNYGVLLYKMPDVRT